MTPWDNLQAPTGSQFVLKSIQVQGARLWSWAKDTHSNIGIAIECRAELFDTSKIEKTKEFIVEIHSSQSSQLLTILCTNHEYKDILEKFCMDLVKETNDIPDDFTFALALKNRINAWCHFFKLGRKKLKHNQVLGLAAELMFIEPWVVNLNEGVDGWVGPLNNSQDFVSTKTQLACEIKISDWEPVSVYISSLEQLNFQGELKLIVYPGKIVDKGEENAINLASIILHLTSKLNAHDFLSVLNKLIIAGYEEKEANEIYFNIGSPIIFDVKDDFPKLINSTVHKNIIDCSYKLLLKDLEQFKSNI